MTAIPERYPRPAAAKGVEPDDRIIARVLAGEKALYALLVRRYNQRLFRTVRAILRQDELAEDVVQQAYVVAYQNLAGFRGESSFATWLTRIAVNEALGRLRQGRRFPHMALIDDGDPSLPTTPRTPEDDAAGRELRRLLEEHIDALPDAYRVVFVMREVDELDTAETAACLGLTEEAVRVRLHRARQALQQSLAAVIGTSLGETFRFDGERCDRIVAAVLARIESS